MEEQQEGNDAESHRREIELLKEEGLLPLDQLLSILKLPQVPPRTGTDSRVSRKTSEPAARSFTSVLTEGRGSVTTSPQIDHTLLYMLSF